MRTFTVRFLVIGSLLIPTGIAWSGAEGDARTVINQAIKAGGGEANLAKFDSAVMKEKGTYYGMGDGLPYTSVIHMQRPDKFKMEIKDIFTLCVDGDKGWMKSNMGVTDLPKEEMELQRINQKAGWIMTLLPLKDKAYTVVSEGAADVDGMKTTVIKVSRAGHPTVKLYFDKKSHHLVKSQFKTMSSEQKKEVTAEYHFSDFKMSAGATLPHRMVLKHDGKLYVEGEVTEMTPAKLDAKTFARPASE